MKDELIKAPDDDQLGAVVESFLDRFRRGERPPLAELAARYPELSSQIRELIPALVELEQHGERSRDLRPSAAGRGSFADSHEEGAWPERLGDYRIIRRIGGGGMGVVYEAEHESLKSRVALKVVHPRYRAEPKYLRRFHAEARTAAGLHHTHIVSVFDYGDHDGVCYYAMQFIIGQPLDHVLADIRRLRDEGTQADLRLDPDAFLTVPDGAGGAQASAAVAGLLTGRFAVTTVPGAVGETAESIGARDWVPLHSAGIVAEPPKSTEPIGESEAPAARSSSLSELSELRYFREIARLGAQVADALEYAHRRGVVHRDIKPSNLLLDSLGNVWVTDFGLAKLEEGGDLSQSRELVGTLRYMAPERLRGRSDRRGDVYSLGATLYELLAFRPPFEDSDQIRLIERIRNERPAPPRQLGQSIPRDLETIVLKALAKDPKDRFGSAGELADELRRFVEGRTIRSRPVSIVEQFWRWCKREPWLAGANIAAALLITVLAVVSTANAVVYRNQARALSDQARSLSDERGRSDAASLDARWRAVDAYTAQARAGRFSGRLGQRFESLEAVRQAMTLLEGLPQGTATASRRDSLRDLAIACMTLADMKPAGRVVKRPADTISTALDSHMTRYALRFRDGSVSVRRCADDHEIAAFKTPADHDTWRFNFSPDGRYLALVQSAGVNLTVWDLEQSRAVLELQGPVDGAAAFSPDSRRIIVGGPSEVLDYDLRSRQIVQRWPGRADFLAFRPDGVQIASYNRGSSPPVCRILDGNTGRLIRTIRLRTEAAHFAWSPDGTTLAVSASDFKIDLWDAATTTRRATLEGHYNQGIRVAYHPAGTILASSDWSEQLRLWDSAVGRHLLNITGDAESVIIADGRIVVFRHGQLIPFEVNPALEYRTLAHAAADRIYYYRPSVRHDGRLLAVGTNQGAVIWDLAHDAELAFLPLGYAAHLMFDTSGDLITSGSTGVLRWPINVDARQGRCDIGPSQTLPLGAGTCGIALDKSGAIVARADNGSAHVATPEGTRRISPLDDCRAVAVSPDGKWLATGNHVRHHDAQVWRIADRAPVAELAGTSGTGLEFSADGKWLMTTSVPCRLWEVGAWREAKRIGDTGGCFSPDGRLIVVHDASKVIRLVETETGRTLARLESPDPSIGWPVFSPDGSRLVVTTMAGPAVHVWDLRTIRRQLLAMGLDWDAPPYSDQDPADPSVPPLAHIEIRDFALSVSRGAALAGEGRWEEAEIAYKQAFACGKSDQPYHWFERAALELAVGDRAAYRLTCQQMLDVLEHNNEPPWLLFAAHAFVLHADGAAEAIESLRLAERRAASFPDVFSEHVMGLALYRNGRFAEALARGLANIARNAGWRCEVLDRLVVAMSQKRLGRWDEAERSLAQAENWIGEHVRDRPGGLDRGVPQDWKWRDAILMHMLLREARDLIGAKLPMLPADVFTPAN
jgi:eukaryotic-like serine/threonine-protein kinase